MVFCYKQTVPILTWLKFQNLEKEDKKPHLQKITIHKKNVEFNHFNTGNLGCDAMNKID